MAEKKNEVQKIPADKLAEIKKMMEKFQEKYAVYTQAQAQPNVAGFLDTIREVMWVIRQFGKVELSFESAPQGTRLGKIDIPFIHAYAILRAVAEGITVFTGYVEL